jgi:hypothetical protein
MRRLIKGDRHADTEREQRRDRNCSWALSQHLRERARRASSAGYGKTVNAALAADTAFL